MSIFKDPRQMQRNEVLQSIRDNVGGKSVNPRQRAFFKAVSGKNWRQKSYRERADDAYSLTWDAWDSALNLLSSEDFA